MTDSPTAHLAPARVPLTSSSQVALFIFVGQSHLHQRSPQTKWRAVSFRKADSFDWLTFSFCPLMSLDDWELGLHVVTIGVIYFPGSSPAAIDAHFYHPLDMLSSFTGFWQRATLLRCFWPGFLPQSPRPGCSPLVVSCCRMLGKQEGVGILLLGVS